MATKSNVFNMFHSARLKLTFFYLAVIVFFSLSVTFGLRAIATNEYNRSNDAQLNRVQDLNTRYWQAMPRHDMGRPDVMFQRSQDVAAAQARDHVNLGLLIINLSAFVFGGILSYWFAGRTLRPIEEAHEAQKRFTADASHELRTPLTSMRLENEVFLRANHFTEDEAREQINSNLEEIKRLEKLSSNLLAIAQTGQRIPECTSVNIAKIIDAAWRGVKKLAEAKGIELRKDVAGAEVCANGDDVRQVLDILLDNALRHGDAGKLVSVSGSIVGEKYVVEICDKGQGISARDLPHIFDRLYRGDKARAAGGYGLGLALAREIVQANGGEIEATNNDDGGATFTVALPLFADAKSHDK